MEYRTLAENRLENVALVEAMLNQNAISSVRVSGQNAGLHGHLAVRFWVLLAILAVGMLIASSASGQAPAAVGRPLSPEITTKAKVSAMERAKAEGLTKADLTPSWPGYTAFQAYYQQYLFGKLMDPAYVAEYGSVMQALLDDLDRAHKNGSPAVKLISDWIVSGASAIAAGNYHPAARVNATLLLAYVDKEAVRGRPPVPAPTALVPLVMLYRADTNPDGVRAAALQGLLRHVKLDAVSKPEHKSGIAGLMLQLAESQPPAGRSPEAHAFMQRYAIDILNFLANPGVTPKTAETLVSLSTTPEKPSLIAAYAASKIGQLKPGQAKVKEPTKVLSSWAARAAATIDKELDRIAKLDPPVAVRDQPAMPSVQTPMAGGAYGGDMYGSGPMGGEMGPGMTESYGSGGMDDMMGGMYDMSGMYGGDMYGPGMMLPKANPQPSEVIAARRQINHVLQQLQHGVTGQQVTGVPRTPGGLLGSATENDKAAFDNWISTVGDVATAINQETLDDRKKFVEELKKQSIALKQLAGIPVDPAEAVAAAPLAVEAVDPAVGALGPGVAAPGNASGPALPAGQVPGASAAPAAGAIVPTPSDDLLQ
ncbi:MAG TPA: hypothetical protein DDZ51_12345 [Planctomycetaceae bacterium]|nr:hypothetical protein [Planctomycetaceae bacterium]